MGEQTAATTVAPEAPHDGGEALSWDSGCSPEVVEELHSLLAGLEASPERFDAEVRELARAHGEAVYSELIYVLSHLGFPASEARPHWERIVRHRESMSERLGGRVDLRVALVSYFLEVNRRLKNPKVIEMQLFERERDCAYRDMLTGLYNYRLFRESLGREVFRADRYGKPVSLIMVDVDHFKHYNDGRGHEAGNKALRDVAGILQQALRKSDIAARYGGDEFAVILPATPKPSAEVVAERTREVAERHRFADEDRPPGATLTLSMGVATFPADASDAADLIRHADRALYLAKAAGRNQVVLYGRSRRSFERVGMSVSGTYRTLASKTHRLRTVNLSEAGVLLRTKRKLAVGTLVELTLEADPPGKITASGRVVNVRQVDGAYDTAVCFTDTRNVDRARLATLVRRDSGLP